jgi:hypothetical protein
MRRLKATGGNMGFFAGELEDVLSAHVAHPHGSPWAILTRMGVHPQQIDRLKKAADDIGQVATLQAVHLQQLRQELELTPVEWARLQAAIEADTFLRLLLYHNYPLDEATNKANAIFAATLKDKLATGGKSENVYAPLSAEDAASLQEPPPHRPRVRRRSAQPQS